MSQASIAAIRFGTGLAPGLSQPADADALLAELGGPDTMRAQFPIIGLAELWPMMAEFVEARRSRRDGGADAEAAYKAARRAILDVYRASLKARLLRAVRTSDGFRERLTLFWADHFTVRGKGLRYRAGPAAYVEEAIRPHVGGRFADMLRAAAVHPVMLAYLDQFRSIGPGSPAGQRRSRGLNENLAREILELHTLGVGASFSQQDVTEFAELLTGLTFDIENGFRFRPRWAEPGAETVLGRSYGGPGRARLDDIYAALDDFARDPATAAHLARKLAVYFVSDDPDPGLVAAMRDAYTDSDGDLTRVYEAMLAHPAAWVPPGAKVRQPFEFIAASLRALGTSEARIANLSGGELRRLILRPLARMGQPYEAPPGPDGWPDAAEAWITPPALAERISWAMHVKRLHGAALPRPAAFAATALGPFAPDDLLQAVRRAESKRAGVGLVLASPAFNRR